MTELVFCDVFLRDNYSFSIRQSSSSVWRVSQRPTTRYTCTIPWAYSGARRLGHCLWTYISVRYTMSGLSAAAAAAAAGRCSILQINISLLTAYASTNRSDQRLADTRPQLTQIGGCVFETLRRGDTAAGPAWNGMRYFRSAIDCAKGSSSHHAHSSATQCWERFEYRREASRRWTETTLKTTTKITRLTAIRRWTEMHELYYVWLTQGSRAK